jgi:hypothetical protein
MSDNLRTSGRIEFDPPIPWSNYRGFVAREELPSGDSRESSILMIAESIETVQTDDGELTRRTALGAVPRKPGDVYGPWGKTRHLVAELDELRVWLLNETGSVPRGYLITDKYDIAGIERWSIEKTSTGYTDPAANWDIRREAAVLVWPDGTSAVEPTGDGFWRHTATGRRAVDEHGKIVDLQWQPSRVDA